MTGAARGIPATSGAAPAPGRGRRLLRAVGYAVTFTLPVAAIGYLVRSRWEPILHLDEAVIRSATDITRARPALFEALVAWEAALQPTWVYLAGSLLCVWVWRRYGWTGRALWAFVTMMVAWNLALDIKVLVARARPVVEDALTHAPGYSFPSGHAANTAAAATTLTILLWPALRRRGRVAMVTGATVVTLVTAVDRVMLGVHYPSDVVAGVALGAGLALASYAGWRPGGMLAKAAPAAPAARTGIPLASGTSHLEGELS